MPLKSLASLFISLTAFISLTCSAGGIHKRKIKKLFKQSQIVNNHFTGFALYDMDRHETIYELNADKYFTPASNTKLFTFYTALKMLGDSIPGLRYEIKNDSLFFWGTGDPSFLNRELKGVNAINFLKQQNKQLFYCGSYYQNKMFGSGWAWDDYNDYYQAEINDIPIENNLVNIYADSMGKLQTDPAYFQRFLIADSGYNPVNFGVRRSYNDNLLSYPLRPVPAGFRQNIPWQTSSAITLALLQDTLNKPVKFIRRAIPADSKIIYNAPADSVYRKMLLTSDNFIAEQLLLVCSAAKYGYLNSDTVRRFSVDSLLADLPDKPQWADGSGLSRLDLATPRSMIALLNNIAALINNDARLHNLLPAGGVSGTLRSAYKTDDGQAFVWAKTGSLSNNYNQSGYLITRKKRRLAFCFMNNNFTMPSKTIRNEMERIITYIHEKY